MHSESKFELYIPLSKDGADKLTGALRLLACHTEIKNRGKDMSLDDALSEPHADPSHVEVAKAIVSNIYDHGLTHPSEREEGATAETIKSHEDHIKNVLANLYNVSEISGPQSLEKPPTEAMVEILYDYGEWIPLPIVTSIVSTSQNLLDANDVSLSYITTGDGGIFADFVFIERDKAPVIVHDYDWGRAQVAEALARRGEDLEAEPANPAP